MSKNIHYKHPPTQEVHFNTFATASTFVVCVRLMISNSFKDRYACSTEIKFLQDFVKMFPRTENSRELFE